MEGGGVGSLEANARQSGAPGLIRWPEVVRRTGLSRSAIERLLREGRFPAARRVGARAVAWIDEEISAWISELPRAEVGGDREGSAGRS